MCVVVGEGARVRRQRGGRWRARTQMRHGGGRERVGDRCDDERRRQVLDVAQQLGRRRLRPDAAPDRMSRQSSYSITRRQLFFQLFNQLCIVLALFLRDFLQQKNYIS